MRGGEIRGARGEIRRARCEIRGARGEIRGDRGDIRDASGISYRSTCLHKRIFIYYAIRVHLGLSAVTVVQDVRGGLQVNQRPVPLPVAHPAHQPAGPLAFWFSQVKTIILF